MTERLAPRSVFTDPVIFLAAGFGSGLAPRAPGTAGTLAAVPLYLLLVQFEPLVFFTAVVVVAVLGVPICAVASRRLGVHDHAGIVWDEIAGYLLTMSLVSESWWSMVLGFALFRLFDIWKPWPIGWADRRVSGGLGIMLDDLLAGGMAAILLWCIVYFLALGQ